MMQRIGRQLAAALLLLTANAAMAQVQVQNAQLRLLPGDLPAAGYFTLTNTGTEPVALNGAQSNMFGQVMIHRSTQENGMARMQHIDQVQIPASGTLAFAPGGYHLMLMQRQKPLALGDQIAITLQFADGQTLPVTFTAVPPGAN
ncbi:MAG: copper chaperone PCu(A)C [Pseudomonas sp.]